MALLLNCVILLTFLCCTTIYGRSVVTNRPGSFPFGCKWKRVLSQNLYDEKTITNLLSCKFRNGTNNYLNNLNPSQIVRITDLRLECSDDDFDQRKYLTTLYNLKSLRMEFCKLNKVPSMILNSMRDLKFLSLNLQNSDWSLQNMEFNSDSFRGLTELITMDLKNNNIWNLPEELFCSLYSLKYLNLTGNNLQEVLQLGFSDWGKGPTAPGKSCNIGLQSLDLSRNYIPQLPNNGFSSLRSLHTLMLQDNLISVLAERSFVGLHSLKMLNMSSNKLIALPPELFLSTREMTQLYLKNNTLSVLAPGLLEGLDKLEILDLSQNDLNSDWIKRNTFAGLIRLVVLNIGSNKLTKIDQHVFRGLYSLQILNLEFNSIELIGENCFSDLKNLHTLTLNNNKLKSLESHYFSDLFVLSQLYIESNQIESIHERTFENLTNLSDLSLNDNRISEIPEGLKNLRFLKSFDLGKNLITTVNSSLFEGLEHLLGLRLCDNLLTSISRDAFVTLSSLHILNLASNKIEHIDQSAFSSNPTIHAIRLDDNHLEDISSVFTSLPELVWLNVSDNKIRWFDYSHLPISLEWLDMHKNNITELGNHFDITNTLQIKMLDVSFNSLIQVNDKNIPDSIETIFLNNNFIETVSAGTFLKKTNLQKVVLYGNLIERMDSSAIALGHIDELKNLPQFYIGDNPFHCDCNLEWLTKINDLSYLRQFPTLMDLQLIYCTTENQRTTQLRQINDLKTEEFLCKYESHCFALCQCCEYDACDCKMTCPDKCNCYHDHTWNINIVDCGNSGITEVPEQIPMDATIVYLDGNNLMELDSHVFIGKKKLEHLYLNGSNIQSINNKTFNGIPSLRTLHLEENFITELLGYEFNSLIQLKEIYLDHNLINEIGEQTFSSIKSLKKLTLNKNNFKNLNNWIDHLDTTTMLQLNIEENRINCDCDSVNKLKQLTNLNKIQCINNQTVYDFHKECQLIISEVNVNDDVTTSQAAIKRTILLEKDLIGGNYIPILSAILIGLIVVALIFALICVFKQDVRLWAHSKYGIRLFKDPVNSDDCYPNYDGYMIYSVKDSDFVYRVISSELQQNGFNLCLHHQNVNETYLINSIQNSANLSKKIIILLSINFLQTEWSNVQFRVALQSMIENIQLSQRKNKIVLILTAPIELIAVDTIIQNLLRTCTVICWAEKRFWEKLFYIMPDVQKKPLKTTNCGPNCVQTNEIPINRTETIATTSGGHFYATIPDVAGDLNRNSKGTYFV